jgi:hypothetical protein
MAISIVAAGYGYGNTVRDAKDAVRGAYRDGKRQFAAENNLVGDPFPGQTKCLFIWWQDAGAPAGGVVLEHEDAVITIPEGVMADG